MSTVPVLLVQMATFNKKPRYDFARQLINGNQLWGGFSDLRLLAERGLRNADDPA